MAQTPHGTSVGVDDPYAHIDQCDHLTDDGRCRFAIESASDDPSFAEDRRAADYACVVANSGTWKSCPHFRSRDQSKVCVRCGLEEHRQAHKSAARPLLEEHHLSYPDGPTDHEITVTLCRWCHAKVHSSWARLTDDATPDQKAIATREQRRAAEDREAGFMTAAERRDDPD